jgi:hypothetical protein
MLAQSNMIPISSPKVMRSVREGFTRTGLAFAIGFIYSISFWKYIKRDPLSSPLGVEAVLETGSVAVASLLALLMLRHAKRRKAPQMGLMLMALYGLFTLVSSYRSFSPVLSITKSAIFFAVIGIGWLMAQADLTWKFLNGIYAGYASITALGLAVGAVLPERYPLILSEEWTHRNRLSLFDTHPNSVAETCVLMFLLGRVLGGRWRWVPQMLLVVINILAGEKTATAMLILIGVGGYLLERRWSPTKTFFICSVLGLSAVAVTLSTTGISELIPEKYATSAAASIYGDKVDNELSTMDGRKEVWQKAKELAMDGVMVGYGIEGARAALLDAVSWSGQAHNGYIEIVLDGGVLGAALFLLGWVLLALVGFRGDRVWLVRTGSIYAMILILAMISPIFNFYSYFSETLVVSLAYLAATHARVCVPAVPRRASRRRTSRPTLAHTTAEAAT